ncbi:16700_t:CDS:2 [Entrophospora sp. SA101]|nr:17850_t:CDS:2 [Entrophospora sp. SA101]CAJ0747621.1 16697_t:CDS:2 [Entrophospora sp. SA101]CAJ0747624.1 16700_t:CDS:2 [Entrophospora sp. SA101]
MKTKYGDSEIDDEDGNQSRKVFNGKKTIEGVKNQEITEDVKDKRLRKGGYWKFSKVVKGVKDKCIETASNLRNKIESVKGKSKEICKINKSKDFRDK